MADDNPGIPPDAPRATRQSGRIGRPPVHGLKTLRRAVTQLTTRRLDGRSAIAVAVRRWKEDIRRDRGGDLTQAQETILEGAAQKLIIRDSLADYIARQGGLVGKKKAVAPVVASFLQVCDSLNRDLERLGLEREAKRFDLMAAIAELQRQPPAPLPTTATGTQPAATAAEPDGGSETPPT